MPIMVAPKLRGGRFEPVAGAELVASGGDVDGGCAAGGMSPDGGAMPIIVPRRFAFGGDAGLSAAGGGWGGGVEGGCGRSMASVPPKPGLAAGNSAPQLLQSAC
jgi:hypothetical protein